MNYMNRKQATVHVKGTELGDVWVSVNSPDGILSKASIKLDTPLELYKEQETLPTLNETLDDLVVSTVMKLLATTGYIAEWGESNDIQQ